MKIYTFIMLSIACPLLSLGAELVVPGVVVPLPSAASIKFEVPLNASLPVLKVLSQGDIVKKGDRLIEVNCQGLDNEIVDLKAQIAAKNLAVEKLSFDLEKEKVTSDLKVAAAERFLARVREDINDFAQKRKPMMLREEEMKLVRAKNNLAYKQEELAQLKLIYGDDNISEASEKIVHNRILNDLKEAEYILESTTVASELAKTKGIVRADEDQKLAEDNARLQLVDAAKQKEFILKEKSAALVDQKVQLERLVQRLAQLEEIRKKADFLSPVDGVLLAGAYDGAYWSTASRAKLRPGAKIENFDCLMTIIPANAPLLVQAWLPDTAPSPEVNTEVKLKDQGGNLYPAVITKSPRLLNNDGKRVIELMPRSSAELIPCMPIQVLLPEKVGAIKEEVPVAVPVEDTAQPKK